MSRRAPNPAAEKAAQNQAVIKNLLKLEPNKICADCKRNKHPRWASWNLGVFVCIRCSGIHRGMGTHISRVKSVDLDSWTDEQMASIVSWGNARANKYWEAKLAAGHVPSEAKIENFIRTKYELKRWVMDGPMPDPSTLDEEGEEAAAPVAAAPRVKPQVDHQSQAARKVSHGSSASRAQADIIGGDIAPPRAATIGPPPGAKVALKADAAPPKTTAPPSSTKDSLLGLDFFGSEPAAPPRPVSAAAAGGSGGIGSAPPSSTGQSRPDLKQSILSLYATAPRSQPPQQPSQSPPPSFGGMPSPTTTGGHASQGSMGGLSDAFGGLTFSAAPVQKAPQPDAFASLGSFSSSSSSRPAPAQTSSSSSFPNLAGGSFFDAKPASSVPSHQPQRSIGSGSSGFGSMFGSSTSPPPKPAAPPAASSSSFGDLFDLSAPVTTSQPATAPVASASFASPPALAPTTSSSSVFNLSAPSQSKPNASVAAAAPAATSTLGSFSTASLSNADVWGSSAWGAPEAAATPAKNPMPAATTNAFGWGSSSGGGLASQSIVPGASGGFGTAPKVAADEEFGGWTTTTTAAPAAGGTSSSTKPAGSGGFGTSEDLFSNVWQ